jgi:release factor glutamine methyltransferase
MTDVRRALAAARGRFARSPTPGLDAELLLAHAWGWPRSRLHAWPETVLDTATLERFEDAVARRAVGEPVAYILGEAEFWSLALEVGPDVLIPRPETEGLVEAVLAHLQERGSATPELLDLGTGSACLAIALAHARPQARVTAVDASQRALAVAERNVRRHGLTNVELRQGDWLTPVDARRFDVIVCNPPYVASDDPHLSAYGGGFEPVGALDGGLDGLWALRSVIAAAPTHLAPHGLLALEHGCDQAAAVVTLCRDAGLVDVSVRPDAAGLARITLARRRD